MANFSNMRSRAEDVVPIPWTEGNEPDSDSRPVGQPEIPQLHRHRFDISPATSLRAGGDAVHDTFWRVVLEANERSRWLYRIGDQLAVLRRGALRPELYRLTPDQFRNDMVRLLRFVHRRRQDDEDCDAGFAQWKDVMLPDRLARGLMASAPLNRLSEISSISTAPVFHRDGVLRLESGFVSTGDGTGTYVALADGLNIDPVPHNPTDVEIATAVKLLQEELLGDFAFVDDASKDHAVGLMLEPLMRPMIVGPTPVWVIDKSVAGSGASLLSKIVGIVVTGDELPTGASMDGEPAEFRKALLALLLSAPPFYFFDNATRISTDTKFLAAVTSSAFEDRLLGVTAMVKAWVRGTWLVTANNINITREAMRRTVTIRLEPAEPDPSTRKNFRHADLEGYAKANRGRILHALYVLARAWIVSGKPPAANRLASFDAWSNVIGGTLKNAGLSGFLKNHNLDNAVNDEEGAAANLFVQRWLRKYGGARVLPAKLKAVAATCDEEGSAFFVKRADDTESRFNAAFGRRLSKLHGRRFNVPAALVAPSAEADQMLVVKVCFEPARLGVVRWLERQDGVVLPLAEIEQQQAGEMPF